MTSEREASEAARQRRKENLSQSIKRIRARRAERGGAPLGESVHTDPDPKRRVGPRPTEEAE